MADALRNAREVIALEIEVMAERGEDLPAPDGDAEIRVDVVRGADLVRVLGSQTC